MHRCEPIFIGDPSETHRPVCSIENALWTKRLQCDLEIRGQTLRRPVFRVSFRHHSREFAAHILPLPEFKKQFAPWIEQTFCDRWLGDVIHNENLLRMPVNKPNGLLELVLKNENVVGQPILAQGSDARFKSGTEQEFRIAFALDDMADTTELFICGKEVQFILQPEIRQWHPTHDALNELMFSGEFQKPAGFLERLARLNGYDTIHTGSAYFRFEVGRHEIPLNVIPVIGNPSEFAGVVFPEVVVGVDNHGWKIKAR